MYKDLTHHYKVSVALSTWYLHSYVIWSREISLKLNMWHFQFSIWLKCSFGEVHFAENSNWIRPVVPKLWAIEGFSAQKKTKEIPSFFWLYLTINAPDFRLIPQDHSTYLTLANLLVLLSILFCTISLHVSLPGMSTGKGDNSFCLGTDEGSLDGWESSWAADANTFYMKINDKSMWFSVKFNNWQTLHVYILSRAQWEYCPI